MKFTSLKLNIAIIAIVLLCICGTLAQRRQYGRPRGYGRQQQNQLFDGEEDSEGIQQVTRDEEDFLNYVHSTEAPPPEVVTPKGTFIGLKQTINGTVVYAFYGIQYAKPPVGNLRFKRPEPAEAIEEPIDATRLPNACPQTVADIFNDFPGEKMWVPNTNMSEDCLYLNIWVPETVFNLKEKELAPVLFWIFGGGFFSGSSSLDVYNGAELAATQGAVVVNVQYRLGPLGFLYLEPGQGNFGLLDQSLGLQWTNQNIEYFGGDPALVTVAGESCGAASVGLHLVSPKSKGYIKRGILSSGLPNVKYALKCAEDVKANSIQLAKRAGCEQKTASEILECLRKVDVDKLISLQWKLYKNMLEFPFSPIVDGYFLPEHPDIIIKKGKAKRADLMMGTVGDEGTYFILYHYINYFSHLNPKSVTYDRFVEIIHELFHEYSETQREAIIDQYTNWENPEDGFVNQQKIGEAVGDALFVCPNRKFADAWSNRGLSVYYYHFTERLSFNPWGKWMGVMHGDDIPLIFGTQKLLGQDSAATAAATSNEKEMIKNFMDMLGNFLRNGVPSQKWERYTSEHPAFLDVNATIVSSASTPNLQGPKSKECAFWNKLLPLINEESSPEDQTHHRHQDSPYQCNSHGQGLGRPAVHCSSLPSPQSHLVSQPHSSVHCHSPPPSETCATNAEPPLTSTSCKCTVQEGPSTEENNLPTPTPAIY